MVEISRTLDKFWEGAGNIHEQVTSANLEDKTKEIFASVKNSYCSVLQIGCIPTDVQGVY